MQQSGHFVSLDEILFSDELTQPLTESACVEVLNLDRYDLSLHLDQLMLDVESELQATGISTSDSGIWNWLGALWGSYLFKNSSGDFFIAKNANSTLERHLLQEEAFSDYRHLLYGNWFVASTLRGHHSLMTAFMFGHPTANNDPFEQIVARREILASSSALELIRDLYVPSGSTTIPPHLARAGIAGGLRRFGSLFSQLATKFDLHGMSAHELKSLLPNEFQPWIDGSGHGAPRRRSKKRR